MVDPLSYFSSQPVLHDWCNKGRRMCYPLERERRGKQSERETERERERGGKREREREG